MRCWPCILLGITSAAFIRPSELLQQWKLESRAMFGRHRSFLHGHDFIPSSIIPDNKQGAAIIDYTQVYLFSEKGTQRKRIVSALEETVKIFPLVFVGIFSYPTFAQIDSGTIIVFHVAKDKFIIAADSRVI